MLSIAVSTNLPDESNNEIANFREKIQECVEQKLCKIGNVKLVDSTTKEWDYYIEINFSLFNFSLIKIEAHFESSITEMDILYHPMEYKIDRLPFACASLVEDFMIEVQKGT